MQETAKKFIMTSSITQLVIDHIAGAFNEDLRSEKVKSLYVALHKLLNGHFVKYDFDKIIADGLNNANLTYDEFQKLLSKINEKGDSRKAKGVYYTPKDVTRYILANVFLNAIETKNAKVYSDEKALEKIASNDLTKKLIYEKTVFDPTCGTGEFLLNAFTIKCDVANNKSKLSDENYLGILATIYGNDIDSDSIEIAQIRLLFETTKYLKDHNNYSKAAEILQCNFSATDYVTTQTVGQKKHDIIVGNPPYVEYGKLAQKPKNEYGNIYADVLKNSVDRLCKNGTVGFVVPLSYIATARMRRIRDYIENNTCKQFILNFADRPDCLFTGVHQKLCILLACRCKGENQLYTSNYRFWYKAERQGLLNGCETRLNKLKAIAFIPKIGNALEESIYKKVFTSKTDNLFPQKSNDDHSLYLNMRATFWTKAFTFNPGSKEYKKFDYNKDARDFVLCVLNSSLFFLFWTMVSDCWHITSKELKHFRLPQNEFGTDFATLSAELEQKLEKTKKFIGSVQTEYEYKHKECKDIIDKIDNEIAAIYKLTTDELVYTKAFAFKYRMGGGA